jgi:phospholipid/cholesterol/gamma-HCH transport system substrate-binding protein
MKNQKATEIKVGVTVLLGLIVFIWVLGWTKNFTFSSSDNNILVKFNNISGLEIGNNVTVNGVKKGHVSDYEIQGDNVIVTLKVDSDVKLKKDATFFLESTDLMGGRKIEIYPGKENEPLDLKSIHQGTYVTDIAGVIALFGDLQDKISIIANETVKTLQSLNSFLDDKAFIQDVKNSIQNLNNVALRFEKVLAENQNNIKAISENTKEITDQTKVFITENKEQFKSTINNLNSAVQKSDSLIAALNFLTKQTTEGKNNLGKILYNDSLYFNMVESMQTINKLTKLLMNQLETDGIKVDANIF